MQAFNMRLDKGSRLADIYKRKSACSRTKTLVSVMSHYMCTIYYWSLALVQNRYSVQRFAKICSHMPVKIL